MTSTRPLFGVETEYAVSGITAEGEATRGSPAMRMLVEAFNLPHLPHRQSGIVLANGSRFYVDHGGHPELATPECTDPSDLVRYVLAGEKLLADIARTLAGKAPGSASPQVFRSNVDYGVRSTWGCHESYLCRKAPGVVASDLVPHLATRPILVGAGGFDPFSSGIEFTLSPRACFIEHTMSLETTGSRGLVNLREESLAAPEFRRLHVIMGETLCSQRATWLKIGATALVVAMAEAGLSPGRKVALAAPVEALHAVARDPSCSRMLRLADGSETSAVSIQEHYVYAAEQAIRHGLLPSWAGPICREWRATVNELCNDPSGLSGSLDWCIKRALFERKLSAHGLSLESLAPWNRLMEQVACQAPADGDPIDLLDSVALDGTRSLDHLSGLPSFMYRRGEGWKRFLEIVRLRNELFEIDARFGQLGDEGIFNRLDAAGVLDHRLPGLGSVERACAEPPRDTRARARGRTVSAWSRQPERFVCDWMGIWDKKRKRMLDLSNPFRTRARWRRRINAPRADPPRPAVVNPES